LATAPTQAPTGLVISDIAISGFQAGWGAVSGATSYGIQVSKLEDFSEPLADYTISVGNVLTYSVGVSPLPALQAGETYYFRVKAVNTGGESAYTESGAIYTITDAPLITVNAITNSFTVSWASVNGANGYQIDIDEGLSFELPYLVDNDNIPTGTTYTATGSLATDYVVRVRAVNAAGVASANSNTPKFSTLPLPPVAIAGTAITSSGFTANWGFVAGANSYKIQVSVDNFANILVDYDIMNNLNHVVTGLLGGTTYYYRVKAIVGFGEPAPETGYSNIITVLTKPIAPTATVAIPIGQNTFTANWSVVVGATSYVLEVSADNFANILSTSLPTTNTQDITGLTSNTPYYYRVRAVNASGASANSNFIQVITTLDVPVLSATTNITANQFRANWGSVAGVASYVLQVATNVGFTSLVYDQTLASGLTSATVTGLDEGTIYYYRLTAKDINGTASPYSSIITVITTPVALPATGVNMNSFTAKWQQVIGADSVIVEVSASPIFANILSGYPKAITTGNTEDLIGLTTLTDYYYRFRAKIGSTFSLYSNTINVKTLPAAPVITPPTFGDATSSTFTAKWTFIAGANNYYLDVSTNVGFSTFVTGYNNQSTGVVNSFPVVGLSAGAQYFYRIRAANGSAVSANSNFETIMTVPNLPTFGLTTSVGTTSFTANWNAPTSGGQTGYRVELVEFNATNNTETPVSAYPETSTTNLTANFLGLNNTKEYRVFLKAVGAFGITEKVRVNVLLKPTALPATILNPTAFTANWTLVTGVTTYFLDVSTGTGTNFNANILPAYNNASVSGGSNVVTGLATGNTYYYKVRAQSGAVVSPNSDETTVIIPALPATPTASAATFVSTTSFIANWGFVAGANSYILEYSNDAFNTNLTAISNITTLSQTVNVAAGFVYTYRVRAVNTTGVSANSGTITVVLPPTATAPTLVTNNSFTANWSVVVGATSYVLEVSTDNFATSTPFTSLIDSVIVTPMIAGTAYKYRVRAVSGANVSPNSNEITVLTVPQQPLIDYIDDAIVTVSSFLIEWPDVLSATSYDIQLSTTVGLVTGYTALNVLANASNTFTLGAMPNPPLQPNTMYTVHLKAVNAGGKSTETTAVATTLPTPPTAITANPTNNGFALNWTAPTGDGVIDNYKIDISSDGTNFTPLATVTGATAFTTATLQANTTYYLRLRADNNPDGSFGESINSNVITILTKPNALTVTDASNIQGDRFTANWTAPVNGASGYLLDVATNNTFSSGLVIANQSLDIALNSYPVLGLEAGKVYYYRLRAVNSTGQSAFSNTMPVITTPVALPATGVNMNSFTAKWQQVIGADSVIVEVSASPIFANILSGYPKAITTGNTEDLIGLTTLTDYYYRFRAKIGSTFSLYSNTINVKTLPAAPVAVAVPFGELTTSQTSFQARWGAVSGANAYYLDVLKENVFGSNIYTAVPTYTNLSTGISPTLNNGNINLVFLVGGAGIQAGKRYKYTVKAGNGTAISVASNEIIVATSTTKPKDLAATPATITGTDFTATWTAPTSGGATNYRVSLYELPALSIATGYDNVDIGNVTTTAFTGLEGGKSYRLVLKAENTHSYSDTTRIDVTTTPEEPLALDANSITPDSFQARWNSVLTAIEYRLDVATDANFVNTLPAYTNLQVLNTIQTVSVTSTLVPHFYRVRAVNGSGLSNNSNTIEVSIPNAPANFVASNLTTSSFVLTWDALSSVNGYVLDIAEDASFSTFVQVGSLAYSAYAVGNVITYTAIDLTAGQTYYARLRAINNGGGVSNNSLTVQVLLLPAAPKSNDAIDIVIDGANSNFVANWKPVASAISYRLDVSTSLVFANFLIGYQDLVVNDTLKIVSNISNGADYYYRVRAVNATGTSLNSSTIFINIPLNDPNTPFTPSNVSLTSTNPTEIDIDWQDNSNNETNFEIQRADAFLGTYATIYTGGASNSITPQNLTYTNTGLTPSTVYWYRVRALGNTSNSTYTFPKSIITQTDAPKSPDDLYAVADGLNSIYLIWKDKSSDENGFKIYRGVGEFGAPLALIATVGANIDSYIDLGLTTGEVYKYTVTAFKVSESNPSNVAFAIPADVPKVPLNVLANVVVGFTDSLRVTWTDVATNETEFVLEGASIQTNDEFVVLGVLPANVTTVSLGKSIGIKANHKYTFRMFARNDAGKSRYSNEAVITTPINPTVAIPIVPSGLVAEAVSTIEIKLRWQDNSPNEEYFIVSRSLSATGTFTELTRLNSNTTNFSDVDVIPLVGYYYRIQAVNAGGQSAISNTANAKAECNIIMVLVPDNPSGNGAVVCDSKHVQLTLNTNATLGKFYWYKNNQLIPDANLSTYIATETGEYYCRIVAGKGNTVCDKKTAVISVIVNPSFSVGITYDLGSQLIRTTHPGADKYQWHFNYLPIVGANSDTYKPAKSGSYYVVVTESTCSATSNVYAYTFITAIENWDMSSQIRLYPNPAKAKEVHIKMDNALLGTCEIRIFDQYGKIHHTVVLQKDSYDWEYKLGLQGMASGMYFVEIRSGKYVGKHKLIVVE